MRPTDDDPAELAGDLFDQVLLPLAMAKREVGELAYFSLKRDATVDSYFSPSDLRSMAPADFEFPGGGSAEGLISSLAAHWIGEGEFELAAVAPRLSAIATALSQAAIADDSSVDIFCYTLF